MSFEVFTFGPRVRLTGACSRNWVMNDEATAGWLERFCSAKNPWLMPTDGASAYPMKPSLVIAGAASKSGPCSLIHSEKYSLLFCPLTVSYTHLTLPTSDLV